MANILIDGYNLIGIAHRNLEQARRDLIQKLCQYVNIKKHALTVVFDGWKDGQEVESKKRVGNITVIYSSLGERADLVIKKVLSAHSQFWIVVSSDREIYDFAEKNHFIALRAEEFETRLNAALSAKGEDIVEGHGEEDFDLTPAGKKGNPRKPSQKAKRKAEALKKL